MNQPGTTPEILKRLERQSLIVGGIGIVACAAGAAWNLDQFYKSYLTGYVFWWGIAVGCLALAQLHQLVHGTWGLLTGRLFESGANTLPIVAVLFLPIAAGAAHLYPWARPDAVAADEVLRHKAIYLNLPAFFERAAVYFGVWIFLAVVHNWWSLKRDRAPSARLTAYLRRAGSLGLVLVGVTVTFAAVDWMMSLEPHWYSTIYGALVALGALLTAFSFVIVVTAQLVATPPLREIASPRVFNDLGSLLLAWVILWTYMAFSQYLITWSGNTTEEISWYLRRTEYGWEWLALAIGVFQFAVPFLLLLSKTRKEDPHRLAHVAAGLLCVGYVNVLWMVAPAFDHARHGATATVAWTAALPRIHWLDLATPVAIGGIWSAAFLRAVRRRPLLPRHDPAWENLAAPSPGGRHA